MTWVPPQGSARVKHDREDFMTTIRSTGAAIGRALLVAVAACAWTGQARADAVEDFYKGKTIAMILGFPAGGGYDNYARPLALHMSRHIPGHPTIIIQNVPGAGGLQAANRIYNQAPKDGSVMGMISAATAFEPLFGNTEARFDTPKYTWIGNIDQIIGTCSVWHTSGLTHFDDLFTKTAAFGGGGAGSASAQHAAALKNLFGAKITLIKGYPGSNEINLAMQRGEIAGACGISLAILNSTYGNDYRAGRLKAFLQTSLSRSKELEGVAHVYDYAKTDEDRGVLDMIFGRYVLGRPILSPPGVPADRTKALRAAFMATMSDPEFLADAKKMKLEINPSSGEDVEKMVIRFFSYPKAVVAKAVAAME